MGGLQVKSRRRWAWLILALALVLPPAIERYLLLPLGFDLSIYVHPGVLPAMVGSFGTLFALLWLFFKPPKDLSFLAISPPLVLVLPPAIEWFRLSSLGFDLLTLTVLCALAGIVGLFVMPFAIFWLFFITPRRAGFHAIVFCAALMGTVVGGFSIAAKLRMHEFHKLAERSEPLVSAIHRYVKEKGQAPRNLEELVPAYLPAVPETGMGAYPRYEYLTGDSATSYHDNPWILYVRTSDGFLNWDKLLYLPGQNYPEQGFGRRFRQVGTWAYLFE